MSSRHNNDDELETIKQIVVKTWEAWNSRDADNGVPYFRNAPQDMFFDYFPLRFDDFQSYMGGTKQYLNTLSVQNIKQKDLFVERIGNTAWAVGTYTVDSESKKGEKFHVDGGRYTGVLVKQDGKWLVCHEHWSPSAPPVSRK